MEKKKIVIDNSISDFIRQSISEIQKGLPEGYELVDEIEFEVSVQAETNRKGDLTFKVISGSQVSSKIQTHKINFSIANPEKQKSKEIANAEVSVKVVAGLIQTLIDMGSTVDSKASKTTIVANSKEK